MSRPAFTIQLFGLYLVGTGVVLVAVPNVLLGLLRVAPATDPWIRVLGVVVIVIGWYYLAAAQAELTAFFRATVWGRVGILAGFATLVGLQLAPLPLLGFGLVDAAGALWTWTALRTP